MSSTAPTSTPASPAAAAASGGAANPQQAEFALPGDMNTVPEELPPYREAAMAAWEKAKAAGAGQFTPGGLEDDGGRLREPLDTDEQKKQEPVPPPVRSVLTFGANTTMALSRSIFASPGVQGALFYRNRSFCFSAGYRDGFRGMHEDDKGNFLRLKDPLGLRTLSTVLFGHLVWSLHKEGLVDMFSPVSTMLPELSEHRKFDGLLPRDILGFSCGMDDGKVLSALLQNSGSSSSKSSSSWRHGALSKANNKSYHESITLPLNVLFAPAGVADPQPSRPAGSENAPPPRYGSCSTGAADAAKLPPTAENMGFLMRQRLVAGMVEAAPRLPRAMPKINNPKHRRPSHFAFALLAAGIERTMGNTPMEDLFRTKVTEPLGIMSVGFGIPKVLYRSSMFWQPTGLPCTHYGMKETIRAGDARHAASPLFNASLNAFGSPEDVAKLLLDSMRSARQAMEEMPQSGYPGARWHELGWAYEPATKRYMHMQQWGWTRRRSPVEFTPYSASALYDDVNDAGSFSVTNCGNRASLLTTNLGARMVSTLFVKQCVETGMDLEPTDEQGRVITHSAGVQNGDEGARKWESNIRPTPGFAQKKDEPKSSSSAPSIKKSPSDVAAASAAAASSNSGASKKAATATAASSIGADLTNMTKEEQIAFMRKQEEEQQKAIDEESSSVFARAQRFFRSGRLMNSEGHKRL